MFARHIVGRYDLMPLFATICIYLQAAGRGQPALHDTFIAIYSSLSAS